MAEIMIFFSLWYPSPKHALFHPHCSDVFLTSIKASTVLSKFYGISREFSLTVLVNSFYHNMALRFPPHPLVPQKFLQCNAERPGKSQGEFCGALEFSQFYFQKLGLIHVHHLPVSVVIHIDLNVWSIQTDIYGISNNITRGFCIAVYTLVTIWICIFPFNKKAHSKFRETWWNGMCFDGITFSGKLFKNNPVSCGGKNEWFMKQNWVPFPAFSKENFTNQFRRNGPGLSTLYISFINHCYW